MKRWKRFLAGLITLAMAMSLMPMMAFAADTTGGASVVDPVNTTPDTIDTTKKGSLTLYKYEFKDGAKAPTTPGGTGLGGQTIPTGATAIKDVGFTLYYVSDLTDYYAGVNSDGKGNAALPTTIPPADLATLQVVGKTGNDTGEKFTNENGQVSWKDLELGIYYVEETTPPQSATSTPVKFYVSIPMTETDGTDWLYDVVVYPKNETSYAGVTLKKIGNGDTNKTIKDAKFYLQKLDAKVTDDAGAADPNNWYYVKNEGTEEAPKYTYTLQDKNQAVVFSTGDSGTIGISGLSYGTYRFIEKEVPDGYIMEEAPHEFYIDTDGKVYDTKAKAKEYENGIIVVNNEKPDVDKQVKNAQGDYVGEDTSEEENSKGVADYSIGDTVPFKIIVDVPSNVDQLKTFTVTDTMSKGLKLTDVDKSSFEIKGYEWKDADNKKAGEVNTNSSASITILPVFGTDGDQTTWEIAFNPSEAGGTKLGAYGQIEITFNATLDEDAVIAGEGNPNDVKLTYSNQILTDKNTEPTQSELTDEVVVYTFQIKLTKSFDDAAAGNTYKAKFQLYRKAADGEQVSDADKKLIKENGTDVTLVKVGNEVELTANGTTAATHTFAGLENGDYYLVETETSPGFNLLKDPVKVTIKRVYKTTITTTTTTNADGTIKETTTHSATKYYSDDAATNEITDVDLKAGAAQEIVNRTGFTLPTTGGVGTYVFVFVGVSMMAAAVILFLVMKKKETDRSTK